MSISMVIVARLPLIVMLALIGLVVSFYIWSQPEPLLETQLLD